MAPHPPPMLVALLQALSSRHAAAAATGDLLEELHALASSDQAPAWPRTWLASRLVLAIAAAAVALLPRMARAGSLVARDAWRPVRRAPAHSLSVMAILALGITVGTLTFSVVDAVLLKPLPLDHADELVSILRPTFRRRRSSTSRHSNTSIFAITPTRSRPSHPWANSLVARRPWMASQGISM